MIPTNEPAKKPRGFASLSPERRREIAKLGGKAAQTQGKAHRFTSEEAQAAGRRGGLAKKGKDGGGCERPQIAVLTCMVCGDMRRP